MSPSPPLGNKERGASRALLSGQRLGSLLVVLLPAAFFPWAIEELFTPAKLLLALLLGLPAFLLLLLRKRAAPDPLLAPRLCFSLFPLLLLGLDWLRPGGQLADAVPFLYLFALPLLWIEIGGGLSGNLGRRRLELLLVLGSVPVLALGAGARLLGWPASLVGNGQGGLAATIGNSNELGDFAAPMLLFLLGSGALASGRRRLLLAVGALCAGTLLWWSDARGAWLAFGAGLLFLAGRGLLTKRGQSVRQLGRAAALFSVAGLLLLLLLPGLSTRLASAFNPHHPTLQVRQEIWKKSLVLLGQRPLLGIGAGHFERAFPEVRSPLEWTLSGTDTVVRDPHNEPLWILVEGGLVGLLFLLAAGGLLVKALAAKRDEAPPERAWRLLVQGTWLVFVLLSLVHSPWHHPAGTLVPFLLLGAAARQEAPNKLRLLPARGIPILFLLLTLALAIFDLRAAFEFNTLLRAEKRLALAGKVLDQQTGKALLANLRHYTTALQDLARTPLLSPWRAFRAQLLVTKLLRLRARLASQGEEVRRDVLPDLKLYETLLQRVLEGSPHHPGAQNQYAELDFERGRRTEALFRLRDAIKATPGAPRLRVNLASLLQKQGLVARPWKLLLQECALYARPPLLLRARLGHVALLLGDDPDSAGRYLDQGATTASTTDLEQARKLALEPGHEHQARLHALAQLGIHPTSLEALNLVAALGFGAVRKEPDALQEANRAVARSKLLIALDLFQRGETALAARNLNLALARDRRLLDAPLLQARILAQEGRTQELHELVRQLLEKGLPRVQLRRRLLGHGLFRQLILEGSLKSLLGPK